MSTSQDDRTLDIAGAGSSLTVVIADHYQPKIGLNVR